MHSGLLLIPCIPHPQVTTGFYDEQIKPWEGAIMTAISNVQENWDGSHHGVKIEVINAFPGGQAASFTPWTGSAEHKKLMAQYGNSMTLISIARDRGCASSLRSLSLTQMH